MFTTITTSGPATAPISIAHLIPAYRASVHSACAQSMARDAYWCAQHGFRYTSMCADLGRIDVARNLAVEQARRIKATHLWRTDEDNWSADATPALATLFDTMTRTGAPIVGANCLTRDGKGMNGIPVAGSRELAPGVYEAEVVGAALMLVDMRKLASLTLPWFVFETTPDGLLTSVPEDLYFCERARKAGHRVVCNFMLKTGHAGPASHMAGPHLLEAVKRAAEHSLQEREAVRGAVKATHQGAVASPLMVGSTAKW
jgi:hypothetical protein